MNSFSVCTYNYFVYQVLIGFNLLVFVFVIFKLPILYGEGGRIPRWMFAGEIDKHGLLSEGIKMSFYMLEQKTETFAWKEGEIYMTKQI